MSTKNNRDSNSNSNSIRRHSFLVGARNAVSTLAAALSAHEYCRLQHLCVDLFLMFVCCFFSFRCSFVVS